MNAFIKAWAEQVVAKRVYIIGATLLIIATALFTGKPIPFDNATERYFVAGDPTLADFDRLLDLYGDNEYLIIGFEAGPDAEDVFDPEIIRAIQRLTDFLDFHRYVTQVRSLTNYQSTHADGDDISTDYLIDDVDDYVEDPALQAQARRAIRNERLALGTIVTEDLRHARMTARVEYRTDTSAHKIELMAEVRELIESEGLDQQNFNIHISGQPLLNERFEVMAGGDIGFLVPVMVVLMLAMLFISFRSLKVILMPWLVIGAGALIVLEIQSYLGIAHTTVDQALLPTLIIIGTGVSVHVVVEFFHFLTAATDGKAAAITTIEHLWRPAFYTAITTSAGFYSLSVTKIIPVKDFALLGAIGPLVLCILAMSALPAVLSYINKAPSATEKVLSTGMITKFTNQIPDFTEKHYKPILAAGVVLIIVTLAALPQIKIDTNYTNFFREGSDVRNDINYFDATFDGVMILDVILDSGGVDGVKDPEFLTKLERFETWLEGRPAIGQVNSLADYLKQINQALNGDSPDQFILPTSREMTAQYLFLYDSSGANEDLSDIKDFDDRYARLSVPMVNMDASMTLQEQQVIADELAANYSELNPLLTGGQVLFTTQNDYTATGMVRSFSVALLIITLFFIVLFRSFKYGLLSIIPSVIPILITGGIAGLSGVYLDLGTTIVGAMTMGIAVDDAIHVMNRYLISKDGGATTKQAIARAMNESGRAVVFSSAVLVLGFSALSFASFVPVILTGAFGAIIMFLALLGDLLFLPAILFWIDGDDVESEKIVSENSANPTTSLPGAAT